MTSVKLEIEYFNNFSLEDLFNMLPARITLKEGEPFNSFRLRIEKALLYNDIEDQIIPSFLANYFCDSTECTGENAWLVRQLI